MPDPIIIQWFLFASATFCAGMIGYYHAKFKNENIINETIVYLIHNNFVKAKKVDGEWEILPLDEN